MNKIKNYNKLNIKLLIGLLFVFGISYYFFDNYKENENKRIDEYNLSQSNLAIKVLEGVSSNTKFSSLKEFNKQFNTNIKPIKNCYFVNSNNGDKNFIFGFKLESKFYKRQYLKDYYVYPSYNLPYAQICAGHCYDRNMDNFNYVISNPCKE